MFVINHLFRRKVSAIRDSIIDTSGDTILVGAPGDDEKGEDAGTVYVCKK